MKEKTRDSAQKVQQALLRLLNPMLIVVFRLFCSHQSKQTLISEQVKNSFLLENWRNFIDGDGQQLRDVLSNFSAQEFYHSFVLLAANAFAVGGNDEQQRQYIVRQQGHAFYDFMEYLITWLEKLARNEGVGEATLAIPHPHIEVPRKQEQATRRRKSQKRTSTPVQPDPVWLVRLKHLRIPHEAPLLIATAADISLPARLPFLLSKEQVAAFLGCSSKTRKLKSQMIVELMELLEQDQRAKSLFFEVFVQELAVGPGELEELLQCTPNERKRWIKDGKLAVLDYREFRKAGQDLLYPVHDRRIILNINQDELITWRNEHQALISLRRKTGAQIAQISKKQNKQIRDEHFALLNNLVSQWKQCSSPQLAAVLQLAYWTQWASRWAKENQLKILRAIKYQERYRERRDSWYTRKDTAIRLLAQTPYAHLSFYQPENPHKYQIELCEDHYETRKTMDYHNNREFYRDFANEIENCPHCMVKTEKEYYSLYYLEISARTFPDLHFSFHIPYSLGKDFFPAPKRLPQVEHEEQAGAFRFGRSLLENERALYRERDVEKHFFSAFALVQNLLASTSVPFS